MTDQNPIKLVTQLNFGQTSSHTSFDPTPDCLRVSPNGRYISINNADFIYLFDLHHPENGWYPGIKADDVEVITPTDTGNYWILYKNNISLITNNDAFRLDFQAPTVPDCMHVVTDCIWGNDHWLLQHKQGELIFTFLSNLKIHTIKHDRLILHVWLFANHLRLLSFSKNARHIRLHEWNFTDNTLQLLASEYYSKGFHIVGIISLDYAFLKAVHAWPNPDHSVTVKLLPRAFTISAEGDIVISEDHVAWAPIIRSNTALSHRRLAEATVYGLDDGLDPAASLGSTPYLITTLQTDTEVHLISSLWHKKLPITAIDHLDRDELAERLRDKDVATLLFFACEDEFPPLEGLAALVWKALKEAGKTKQLPLFVRKRQPQILQLFSQIFLEFIKQDREEACSNQYSLFAEMYEILQGIQVMPALATIFFVALNDESLHVDLRDVLQRIVHVLPKRMKAIVPAHLINKAPSLRESILDAEPDGAVFLINMAPTHFFSGKNLISLFECFHEDSTVVEQLLKRMGRLKKRLDKLSSKEMERLNNVVGRAIDTGDGCYHRYLLVMHCHGLALPEQTETRYVNFLHFFSGPDFDLQTLAEIIVDHASDEDKTFASFISMVLETTEMQRLIPRFINTLSDLNLADEQNDLIALSKLDDDHAFLFEQGSQLKLIEAIWHQADMLKAPYRRAFAKVFLATIKRCYGEATLEPGFFFPITPEYSVLTAEAALLQGLTKKASNPLHEMQTILEDNSGSQI